MTPDPPPPPPTAVLLPRPFVTGPEHFCLTFNMVFILRRKTAASGHEKRDRTACQRHRVLLVTSSDAERPLLCMNANCDDPVPTYVSECDGIGVSLYRAGHEVMVPMFCPYTFRVIHAIGTPLCQSVQVPQGFAFGRVPLPICVFIY